jgi:hypothetical protein
MRGTSCATRPWPPTTRVRDVRGAPDGDGGRACAICAVRDADGCGTRARRPRRIRATRSMITMPRPTARGSERAPLERHDARAYARDVTVPTRISDTVTRALGGRDLRALDTRAIDTLHATVTQELQGTATAAEVRATIVAMQHEANEAFRTAAKDVRVSKDTAHTKPQPFGKSAAGVKHTAWKETRVEGLRIVSDVSAHDLLAQAQLRGHTFRPTLVARMDIAPEKCALVSELLAALCAKNEGHTAIIGSSTVVTGSPDFVMNDVAAKNGVPIVRVNNGGYLLDGVKLQPGVKPDQIDDPVVRRAFTKDPHYAFADGAAYGDALAVISNVAILAGGRADALRELKGKIDAGHPVVFLDVPNHRDSGHAWDAARVDAHGNPAPRTDDAIAYITHQLAMIDAGKLDQLYPDFGGITKDWLLAHREDLRSLLVRVELAPGTIAAAVDAVQAHLTPRL